MAITDKEKGVWGLDQVYNKINQGSIWEYSGASALFVVGTGTGYGALAQNNTTNYSSPVQIPGTTWDVPSCYVDENGGIARKTDGTLWNWGTAGRGRLGNNDESTNYSSPIQIPGTSWSSTMDHNPIGSTAGAFRTGGQLWMWGYNNGGQLGINQGPGGNSGSFSSPVQIIGTQWSSGCSANGTTAAIRTDGTLWMWGHNSQGPLAQNNRTQYSSPTQVPGTTWANIQISSNSVGAIKTDGTLWGWGACGYGVLGNNESNTLTARSSPVQVGSDTTWDSGEGKFSKGHLNCSAVKTDGTLWTWGAGWYGALGDPSIPHGSHRSSPVQVPGTTWNQVSSGTYNTFATKTDGTLWTWGYNLRGTLGHNNTTNYSSPTQVTGSWGAYVMGGQNGSAVFEGNI